MEKNPNKSTIYVISGPSGVGKGTLCRKLLAEVENLSLCVSTTSRPQRASETDGIDYFFVAPEVFQARIDAGAFLEWAVYNRHYYGTSRAQVDEHLAKGRNVLLEIDVQGALAVKKLYLEPEARMIFIAPPSMGELARRLRARGTNDEIDIQNRLAIAQEELADRDLFEYVLVNDDLEACYQQLLQVILSE